MDPTTADPFDMNVEGCAGADGSIKSLSFGPGLVRMEVNDGDDLALITLSAEQAVALGISLITLARKATHVSQE